MTPKKLLNDTTTLFFWLFTVMCMAREEWSEWLRGMDDVGQGNASSLDVKPVSCGPLGAACGLNVQQHTPTCQRTFDHSDMQLSMYFTCIE